MNPVDKLTRLGIHSKHFLTIEENGKKMCLVILDESLKIAVLTPPFEVAEGILIAEDSGRHIHTSLPQHLEPLRKKLGCKFAYLSNSGFDLMDVKQKSYLFPDPVCELGKLRLGEKFRTALLCVDIGELSADKGINLENALSSTKEGKLFLQKMSRTDFPDLLKMDGLFTCFVLQPSGDDKLSKNSSTMPTQKLINPLAQIFAGIVDDKFNGEAVNLFGDVVVFKDGIPSGAKKSQLIKKCGNGSLYLVDRISLPSSVHELTTEQKKHLGKFRPHETLAMPKLGAMVKELEIALQDYVAQQMKDMLIQMELIKTKMTGINQNENVPNLIAISFALQSIFKQVREL